MKHKLNTKAQHLLFYFLSALILFQLSAPFAFHPLLRVCLALSAAPAPARSIRNLLFNLREKNLRDQYLFFLQSLSGDLSSGSSPAQAVLNAAAQAEHSLGKQAVLTRLLHRSRQLLLNQHPLSRVLEEFAEGLPLKEGKVLLFALAANEQLGEKAVVLIREAKERSAALRDLEAEARAEQFGQILQALCLTATPFVLAYLFEKMFLSFDSGPRTLPATLFMVTAFILATVAVGSAGHILFPPPKRNKRPHDKSFLTVFLDSLGAAPPVRAANRHLLNRLPRFYLSKQRQLIKASHLPQEFALKPDEHGTEQMLILFTEGNLPLHSCSPLFASCLSLCDKFHRCSSCRSFRWPGWPPTFPCMSPPNATRKHWLKIFRSLPICSCSICSSAWSCDRPWQPSWSLCRRKIVR